MGHIGDSHPHNVPALVFGVVICMGPASVIMIACIGRINRDQGHVPHVFSGTKRRWFGLIGLCDHLIWETVRDAVLVDGNQRHGFGGAGIS